MKKINRTVINENTYSAGVMYAPFCRTKAFPEEEWEKDITNIKKLGFTCLHGFVEWHHIEAKKGVYDFSRIDRLLDLCEKHGITAILNVATANGYGYYLPRWLMNEYTGTGVVNSEGLHSWEGKTYTFPCLDDPWYKAYAKRYIKAIAKHFAGDKRVSGWVLWGEPSVGFGGKPICYCEHTVARFREWLQTRYNTIEELNEAWGTDGPSDFIDFCSVIPPAGADAHDGSYASWQDWREYMDENLAGHIKEADTWFKEEGAMQPTITEMFCYFGEGTYATIDPWKLAETSDIVGCSDFQQPGAENAVMMTIADSISKHQNKTFFAVEVLGGPKYFTNHTLGVFQTPTPEELVAEGAQVSGYGAKGYMYWCYRPRFTDKEAGEFGLTKANGTPLPRAEATGKLAGQLANKYRELNAAYRKSEVAIFESTRIQRLCSTDCVSDIYNRSVRGAMALIRDMNANADIINDEYIMRGRLSAYKVLILPYSYMLDECVINKIAEFVDNGGKVIADYPLGIKNTIGNLYITAPGGKLQDLFGFEKDDAVVIDDECRLEKNDFEIPVGTFVDLITNLDADVKYKFGEKPLVIEKKNGKGTAIYMAFEFFKLYNDTRNQNIKAKFIDFIPEIKPYILSESYDRYVTTSCLELENGDKMVTVLFEKYGETSVKFSLDGKKTITDFLTDESIETRFENGKTYFDISLKSWGYRQIRIGDEK